MQKNRQEIFEKSMNEFAEGTGSMRLEVNSEIVRVAPALGNHVEAVGLPAGSDWLGRLRLEVPCQTNGLH